MDAARTAVSRGLRGGFRADGLKLRPAVVRGRAVVERMIGLDDLRDRHCYSVGYGVR